MGTRRKNNIASEQAPELTPVELAKNLRPLNPFIDSGEPADYIPELKAPHLSALTREHRGNPRPRMRLQMLISDGTIVPSPDSPEASQKECGSLFNVWHGGVNYSRQGRFDDLGEALVYAQYKDDRVFGLLGTMARSECVVGGCSGAYAVWCSFHPIENYIPRHIPASGQPLLQGHPRTSTNVDALISRGKHVPAPGSVEAQRNRCGALDPVNLRGRNYWLEATFADMRDAIEYLQDNDYRLYGSGAITQAECMVGGCSGRYAVWCYRVLSNIHPRVAKRPRPRLPHDRVIPAYLHAGQYPATRERMRFEPGRYRSEQTYGCEEVDPARCPPKMQPAHLSDWNTVVTDGDRQLPPGIPDWALPPLLTAGGILLYLLVRKLLS